jgi:hypothetical protein
MSYDEVVGSMSEILARKTARILDKH